MNVVKSFLVEKMWHSTLVATDPPNIEYPIENLPSNGMTCLRYENNKYRSFKIMAPKQFESERKEIEI